MLQFDGHSLLLVRGDGCEPERCSQVRKRSLEPSWQHADQTLVQRLLRRRLRTIATFVSSTAASTCPLHWRVVAKKATNNSVKERAPFNSNVPVHAFDRFERDLVVERRVRSSLQLRHFRCLAPRTFQRVDCKAAHDFERARAVAVEVAQRFRCKRGP